MKPRLTKKTVLRIILIVAATLVFLPIALALIMPVPGSAAWERTDDGSFDRLYGADPFSFALSLPPTKKAGAQGASPIRKPVSRCAWGLSRSLICLLPLYLAGSHMNLRPMRGAWMA